MFLKKALAFETVAKLIIAAIVLSSVIIFIMWQLKETEESVKYPMEASEESSIINSICYSILLGNYVKACEIIENHREIQSKYCLNYGKNKIKCDFSGIFEGCCVICDKDNIANSRKC